MALTRAQLLMGNSAQGTVLAGEVQGVKQSAGISIGADGSISVNSQTIVGVMKMGQTPASAAAAYNAYDYPAATGTVGQQLTISAVGAGVTTLQWGDPDQIPWTAKGQLVVGTGAGTQALQDVGANGTFLFADSATTSGLNYTNTVLRTTTDPTTGAAIMPASTTANRPSPVLPGYTRFNTDTNKLEVYGTGTWETVPSSSTTSFVPQTSVTGSAVLPSGSLGQRDATPVGGYTRFNSSSGVLEFYNGTTWLSISASSSGAFVSQSVPASGTASAIVFPGTTAQRQSAPAAGYLRFNTDTGLMEFYDGLAWSTVTSSTSGTFVAQTVPITGSASVVVPSGTTAQRQSNPTPVAGYFRFNTDVGFMEFYNGTAWSTVISSATGTFVAQTVPTTGTASAVVPFGTTAQRQTVPAPAAGYLRFNTTTTLLEVFDGVAWTAAGAPPTAGLGVNITGSIVKVSIPQLTAPPVAGAGAAEAIDGSLYWDSILGAMYIRYNNGGSPTWVQAVPSASLDIAALPALP